MTFAGRTFKCGLVVGKFCPLHRGHQLVIDTALRRCDDVIVISYTKPDFPGYETERRRAWFAQLYPQVQSLVVDDAWLQELARKEGDLPFPRLPHNDADEETHRRFCGWLCRHVLAKTVDAVFTSEGYGDGFAASLTRYFQALDPLAPPVLHVEVDRARSVVPISGTHLRDEPWMHRAFVEDMVYASLIGRVAFIGGESTGKSTLSQAVAEALETQFVAEYGRELWEAQDGVLAYDDLLKIARIQVAREERASLSARRWLFCDTTPLTTLFYCLDMFARADPELEQLAGRRYDHIFLCAPDFGFVQDGTRQDPGFRDRQHGWYLSELGRRGLAFSLVEGSVAARVDAVRSVLGA